MNKPSKAAEQIADYIEQNIINEFPRTVQALNDLLRRTGMGEELDIAISFDGPNRLALVVELDDIMAPHIQKHEHDAMKAACTTVCVWCEHNRPANKIDDIWMHPKAAWNYDDSGENGHPITVLCKAHSIRVLMEKTGLL